MKQLLSPLLASVLALSTGGTAAQDAALRQVGSWKFRVYLDDKAIGHHDFTLLQQGERRELRSVARFDVKFLFINAYQYQHEAIEGWQGDCLHSMKARTDDNGKLLSVTAIGQTDVMNVSHPAGSYVINGCAMSFAYWNPLMLQQQRLLNAQTGEYDQVKIESLGRQPLTVRGVQQSSNRYRLLGSNGKGQKLEIDLWYSLTGDWLALQSKTDSGRYLRYTLN
jgi:Family of unknown function (DUF6134)